MPVSSTGEGIGSQVTATKSILQQKEPSASSNRWTAADSKNVRNSGALGVHIIFLSDDDEDDEEKCVGKTRSICALDSASAVITPAKSVLETPRWSATTVRTYAAQCNACWKWRLVPTEEEYHAISDQMYESPFVCEAQAWRENVSCEDPSDISENEPSILWAVDTTKVPQPPLGFGRKVVVRGERSSNYADVYYLTPCGRRLRSTNDVQRFLDKRKGYKRLGVNLSQFSFVQPKPGPNLHKRAFKKCGKVWKIVNSGGEGERLQSAISSSRSRPLAYRTPFAMLDSAGKPV